MALFMLHCTIHALFCCSGGFVSSGNGINNGNNNIGNDTGNANGNCKSTR